jgi:hypothetical protein
VSDLEQADGTEETCDPIIRSGSLQGSRSSLRPGERGDFADGEDVPGIMGVIGAKSQSALATTAHGKTYPLVAAA